MLSPDEIDKLSYRELQAECVKHKIFAKGKSHELKQRLIDFFENAPATATITTTSKRSVSSFKSPSKVERTIQIENSSSSKKGKASPRGTSESRSGKATPRGRSPTARRKAAGSSSARSARTPSKGRSATTLSAIQSPAAAWPPVPSPPSLRGTESKRGKAMSREREILMQKAMNAPLPVTPRRPSLRSRGKRGAWPLVWKIAVVALLLVAVLGTGWVMVCRKDRDCIAELRSSTASLQRWTSKKVADGREWIEYRSEVVTSGIGNQAQSVTAQMSKQWTRIAEAVHQASKTAWESYEDFFRRTMWSDAERGSGAIDVIEAMEGRHKTLNTQVLQQVLRPDLGDEWHSMRRNLEEIWEGRPAADDEKANVVLFVCDTMASCTSGMEELSVAAPREDTIVLTVTELLENEAGWLQARLVEFLKDHPNGVIIISGNLDMLPSSSLSTLINAMSKHGALVQDGSSVSTTDATFFFVWKVAPAIMAEESAAGLTIAAKGSLNALMKSRDESEKMAGMADSFRKRIDVVAPMASA